MGTIASSLGYKLPDGAAEDSHDLLPLLKGRKKLTRERYMFTIPVKSSWAIRVGEWNLIVGKTGYHSRVRRRAGRKNGIIQRMMMTRLSYTITQKILVSEITWRRNSPKRWPSYRKNLRMRESVALLPPGWSVLNSPTPVSRLAHLSLGVRPTVPRSDAIVGLCEFWNLTQRSKGLSPRRVFG